MARSWPGGTRCRSARRTRRRRLHKFRSIRRYRLREVCQLLNRWVFTSRAGPIGVLCLSGLRFRQATKPALADAPMTQRGRTKHQKSGEASSGHGRRQSAPAGWAIPHPLRWSGCQTMTGSRETIDPTRTPTPAAEAKEGCEHATLRPRSFRRAFRSCHLWPALHPPRQLPNARVVASSYYLRNELLKPQNVLDGDEDGWAADAVPATMSITPERPGA